MIDLPDTQPLMILLIGIPGSGKSTFAAASFPPGYVRISRDVFRTRAREAKAEEIRPYFIWRQNDASKNSLSMLAQSLYSHAELVGKKREELMELCRNKGKNWNELEIPKKRGVAVYRRPVVTKGKMGTVTRMKFFIDREIPVFSSDSCTLFEELV